MPRGLNSGARLVACALCAALVAVLGAGCGGSNDPNARISPGLSSAAGVQQSAAASARPGSAPTEEPDPAVITKRVEASIAKAEQARKRKQQERRAVNRRNALAARRAAGTIAAVLGYRDADVSAPAGGRTVAVLVDRDDACRAGSVNATALEARIREALPDAHTVKLGIRDVEGRSLDTYVAARCPAVTLADFHGASVLQHKGSGVFITRSFDAPKGRWQIDYATSGTFLQVIVVDDDEGAVIGEPVVREGAGRGSTSYDAHGTFALRIAGDGRWAVRVRRRP